MTCQFLLKNCSKCKEWKCNALPIRVTVGDIAMCEDPLNFAELGEPCDRYLGGVGYQELSNERRKNWVNKKKRKRPCSGCGGKKK